jgi:hypothetical protein
MCCTTRKITLVLLPHLTRNLISPSDCLRSRQPAFRFTHGLGTHFISEVRGFVGIRVNVLRVVYPDEVVKRCKCRQNEGLTTHIILRKTKEDSKTPLEDIEDPLNDIVS